MDTNKSDLGVTLCTDLEREWTAWGFIYCTGGEGWCWWVGVAEEEDEEEVEKKRKRRKGIEECLSRSQTLKKSNGFQRLDQDSGQMAL